MDNKAVRVVVGPVKVPIEGDILRLVSDGTGAWMETWDGSAWIKGGSAGDWFAGRIPTESELMRLGIMVRDPCTPRC